jgi:hypothetical protein
VAVVYVAEEIEVLHMQLIKITRTRKEHVGDAYSWRFGDYAQDLLYCTIQGPTNHQKKILRESHH